jgi:hypothetical protein
VFVGDAEGTLGDINAGDATCKRAGARKAPGSSALWDTLLYGRMPSGQHSILFWACVDSADFGKWKGHCSVCPARQEVGDWPPLVLARDICHERICAGIYISTQHWDASMQ